MNQALASWAAAGLLLLTACGSTREYKTADLASDKTYKKNHRSPELDENEVLGLKSMARVTDGDIQRVLDETRSFRLSEGSTILVVQSGAPAPDPEMVSALGKHFTVVPHTGVPSEVRSGAEGDVSKALRLDAARAKAETVLVYWGHVELKRDGLPTDIVSWVPVVDFLVPDEHQKMRLYLTVAMIDVRTGQWATFRTEPIEEQTLTTRYAREKAPNWPLSATKTRAYSQCVQRLVDSYVMARK